MILFVVIYLKSANNDNANCVIKDRTRHMNASNRGKTEKASEREEIKRERFLALLIRHVHTIVSREIYKCINFIAETSMRLRLG